MTRIILRFTNNFFINVVTSMSMYEIFVSKKSFIMCDWILIRSRCTHRIFWLIHCNLFFIFRTCRIICNVFLMTLLKNMFVFTLLCRSVTFKTSHMNIKRFKRNENLKNINLTSYDDSMMNMFIRTSFKRINFVQRMSDFKFISIIVLRIATSKNACSSSQFSFFRTWNSNKRKSMIVVNLHATCAFWWQRSTTIVNI